MNKLTLNEKKYQKFLKKYDFIIKKLIIPKNHFDANGKMVGFCLAVIDNISYEQWSFIKDNWLSLCKLFNKLYENHFLETTYKSLLANIDIKINAEKCFEFFVNDFIKIFPNIKNKDEILNILQIGLCYLLYNSIPCKISKNIDENVINAKLYNQKIKIISKNVEIFIKLKIQIINYFKNNVNNLFCLISGLSQKMYKD